MKYPRINRTLAVAVLFGAYLGTAPAQKTSPDYETTATWIQSKFAQLGASTAAPNGASKNIRYSFSSMNNCTLLFSLDSTIMDDKGVLLNYNKVTYTIPLSSVNHVSFATGPGDSATQRDVNIEGGTNAFLIKTEKFVDNSQSNQTKAQVKAQRVAEAKKEKANKDLLPDPEPLDVTTRSNFAFIQLDRGDVNNLDLAPRLAAAITRAASICKAQAPKNAEPF